MSSPQMLTYLKLNDLPPLSRAAVFLAKTIVAWEIRRRSRIDLDHLDARLLDDIGIDTNSAKVESEKPFWQD
jgi:uncharacterized protein YjiS (DUF1127 family)